MVSETDGPEHNRWNPKTPGVDAGYTEEWTSAPQWCIWWQKVCNCPLQVWSVGAITMKICSISTCIEVVLSEGELVHEEVYVRVGYCM